jgi:chromosome segregation ATPase
VTTSETEQIRRQIEGTRRELSANVNALTEKVSPSRAVERRIDRARGSLINLKDRIMGTAHDFSVTTGSSAGGVTERVSETASEAADALRSAPGAVRRQTEGNPLAAGLIAFGAGWLVSSLLPTTRKERELAGQATELASERLQPVAQQVRQAATEVRENLREPAQQAAQSVKSTASDAASTVTDESRSATQHVAGRAGEAQHRVAGRSGESQQHVTGRSGEPRTDIRDQTTT